MCRCRWATGYVSANTVSVSGQSRREVFAIRRVQYGVEIRHVGAHAAADDLVGLGDFVLAAAHEVVRAVVLAVLVPVHEAIARAGVGDAPGGRVVRVVKSLCTKRRKYWLNISNAAQPAQALSIKILPYFSACFGST